MKILFCLWLLFLSAASNGQKIVEAYQSQADSLQIGFDKKDYQPYNEKGYTLVVPDTVSSIQGILISLEDNKFNLKGDSSQQIYREAASHQMAVLYVSTGIPLDLYFSDMSLYTVDTLLKNIFKRHHLSNKNIFFLGVNLSGHRALKYIDFCKNGRSSFHPDVRGIILCDGVLDWVRQWYEEKKAIRDHFAESSIAEGKLVTFLLEHLKGTPKTNLEKYLDFSSYSYFDVTNRHIRSFKEYAVRAYTEPATYYWLEAKRKTTFDTNFPDMVGIINELKLAGNANAELIVFHQDKKNMERRNPNYTWGLVDKEELINWIIRQIK
jgi:hypothetical protein